MNLKKSLGIPLGHIVIVLLLSLFFSAKAQPVSQLKVLSFNIWVQGGLSLSNCVRVIRTTGADLVGLQECNTATAQNIATNLGFYVYPAPDCSIVSRYPIIATFASGSSRGITVQLSPGQHAHFFNCHLSAFPYGPYDLRDGKSLEEVLAQENQIRVPELTRLLSQMASSIGSSEPVFLTGDFNAPSHLDYESVAWPTSLACINAGLLDSYRELHPTNRTFPTAFAYNDPGITWTPKTNQEPRGVFDRIDFVYYSGGDGTVPGSSLELDERNSVKPWPSDHRAVLATFTIAAPSPLAKASHPFPVDGNGNSSLAITLDWLPGSNAVAHAVYFGTLNSGSELSFLTNTSKPTVTLSNLMADTTYYWRVDELTENGAVAGDLWSFNTGNTNAVYEWDFQTADLSPSLGRGVLSYADGLATSNLTQFGTTDGIAIPHIAGKAADYLHVPAFSDPANGYRATFVDSPPNGGGQYINRYTMIFDLLFPEPSGWLPVFNTNPGNANDADFYVDPAGAIGIGDIGYSATGTLTAHTWYRIALAADLAAGTVNYYVNGNPVYTGKAALDGRFSIYSNVDPNPGLLLFNEGDSAGVYTHELYLSSFLFTDRTMSPAEILELGAANARGIIFPVTPVKLSIIRQGENIRVSWVGDDGPYQVQTATQLENLDWRNMGSETTDTESTFPADSGGAFYRVIVHRH